jgi:hypothetical protein
MSQQRLAQMKSLRAALDLSKAMLETARDRAWPDLEGMEERRAAMLREAFKEAFSANEALEAARIIKALLQANNELLSESQRGRDKIAKDRRMHARGRKASKAYTGVT